MPERTLAQTGLLVSSERCKNITFGYSEHQTLYVEGAYSSSSNGKGVLSDFSCLKKKMFTLANLGGNWLLHRDANDV